MRLYGVAVVGCGDTGIEFLAEDEKAVSEEVVCQICGDVIIQKNQRFLCRGCKTPHHQDC